MSRISWVTDIHLNFLDQARLDVFIDEIRGTSPDALFVTGDIAEAPNVGTYLALMELRLDVPIYFVLGNHDYYNGRIGTVRTWAEKVTKTPGNLFWMPKAGVVRLTDRVGLVGVDGWGDGRFGKPNSNEVFLNDWLCIGELLLHSPMSEDTHISYRVPLLNKLGDQEAGTLRPLLQEALERFEEVYVLTHVPPWVEATWHRGQHSEPAWQPWFSCKAVGDVIVELAERFPERKVTVLCGHTHGRGVSQIRDNVVSRTGGARYSFPEIQQVFEF